MRAQLLLFTIALVLTGLLSCERNSVDTNTYTGADNSSAKTMSNLAIDVANATISLNQATNYYTIVVPVGTNLKALRLTFNLSAGAVASPASGTIQDFSNPVVYTITAADKTTQLYTVRVTFSNVTNPTMNNGKTCLISKIEEVGSLLYYKFSYDNSGRITQVDANASITTYESNYDLYTLKCTYNDQGQLVEANVSSPTRKINFYSYKYFYTNGKLVREAYKNEQTGTTGSSDITVNASNQIIKYTTSSSCRAFVYTDGAISKEVDCITGTTVYTAMEYGDTRNIFYGQKDIPAFLYAFNGFATYFERTRLFPFYFGEKSPTKISEYFYPGSYVYKRSTMTYTTNSDGFPTAIQVYYEPNVKTDFPMNSTINYKITYTNCN